MAHLSRKLIGSLLKTLSLKGVKKMSYSFDPYHPRVLSIRDLLFFTNSPKIMDTNLDVSMKVNIKSDRSDPVFDVTFVDDSRVIFKTKNLMTEDILTRFHQMCVEKAPKEDDSSMGLMTKSSKKRK